MASYNKFVQSQVDEELEILWAVWCGIKRLSYPHRKIPDPESITPLGKRLFEAAIIGEKLFQIEVSAKLSSSVSTFHDHISGVPNEQLFWYCHFFIDSEGRRKEGEQGAEWEQLMLTYCNERQISFVNIVSEFIDHVRNLPIYPVYDWLFRKELELGESLSSDISNQDLADSDCAGLKGFAKMRCHLLNVFLGVGGWLLSGLLLLGLILALQGLGMAVRALI